MGIYRLALVTGLPAVAMLLACPLSAQAGQIQIKIDMDDPGSQVTQSDYISCMPNDCFEDGTPLDSSDGLPAGVTAGFGDNYGVGTRDRGVPNAIDVSALGLDDLLRDFDQLRSYSQQGGDHFEFRGLPESTYDVTIYSVDLQYGDRETNTFEVNGVVVGPIGLPVDNDLSTMTATLRVTLDDGSGVIRIATTDHVEDDLGSFKKICGLELMEVPEPATLGPLAVGGLAALGRRRRR